MNTQKQTEYEFWASQQYPGFIWQEQTKIVLQGPVQLNGDNYTATGVDKSDNLYQIDWEILEEYRNGQQLSALNDRAKNEESYVKIRDDFIETITDDDGYINATDADDQSNACDWDNYTVTLLD